MKNYFLEARRDDGLVVLEGLHPLKHAVYFEAEIEKAVSPDKDKLIALASEIAPAVVPWLSENVQVVLKSEFESLSPWPPRTGVIAIAKRPMVAVQDLLSGDESKEQPIIFLEEVGDLENAGAVVRVAAAVGAAAVFNSGTVNPWHPACIRGGAGLQMAVPVAPVEGVHELASSDRPLLAFDPTGDEIVPAELPANGIYIFGNERHGIKPETLAQADKIIRLPMRPQVSSLNLATSVAVALYAWRLKNK